MVIVADGGPCLLACGVDVPYLLLLLLLPQSAAAAAAAAMQGGPCRGCMSPQPAQNRDALMSVWRADLLVRSSAGLTVYMIECRHQSRHPTTALIVS